MNKATGQSRLPIPEKTDAVFFPPFRLQSAACHGRAKQTATVFLFPPSAYRARPATDGLSRRHCFPFPRSVNGARLAEKRIQCYNGIDFQHKRNGGRKLLGKQSFFSGLPPCQRCACPSAGNRFPFRHAALSPARCAAPDASDAPGGQPSIIIQRGE